MPELAPVTTAVVPLRSGRSSRPGAVAATGREQVWSDDIERIVVENRLFDGFGILADQVDLTVRAATVVKAHDATVGG